MNKMTASPNFPENTMPVRDQIDTTGDLFRLKQELLFELRELLQQPVAPAQKPWLKSADVRKLLSISDGTLQTLRINGTIPYTKIGGAIYYAYSDIQKLLEGSDNLSR